MKKYIYLLSAFTFITVLTSSQMSMENAFEMNEDEYQLVLPDESYNYEGIELPEHIMNNFLFGITNRFFEITNGGATLGRVLFYDRELTINRTLACGSCHQQYLGFADDKVFSEGFDGMSGERNAMHIADLGTSPYQRLLWDDSHENLKIMSLLPLENGLEMGITLEELVTRMEATDYYPDLFYEAFGSTEITPEKIGEAFSQFLSSIVAIDTKLDQGIANNFADFTDQEIAGKELFVANCGTCHQTITSADPFANPDFFLAFEFMGPHNTGLDMNYADDGVANHTGHEWDHGKFKTPNLKNTALTAPYMHDGRFATLEEVIDFYSDEVQPHPNSTFMNHPHFTENFPVPFTGFGFNQTEKDALLAFLLTLTDESLVNNPMWSDPFELVSGTDAMNTANAIKVSPNPMRHTATIDLGSFPNHEAATIRLMQLNGQVVKEFTTNNRHYTLLREQLPAGAYLLEIVKDGVVNTQKVMMQ